MPGRVRKMLTTALSSIILTTAVAAMAYLIHKDETK
jgi:hypothetical protein